MLLRLVYQDDCNLLELVQRLKRQNIKDFVVNQRRMRVKVKHPIVRSLWLQQGRTILICFNREATCAAFFTPEEQQVICTCGLKKENLSVQEYCLCLTITLGSALLNIYENCSFLEFP